jgi:hypothetical protein
MATLAHDNLRIGCMRRTVISSTLAIAALTLAACNTPKAAQEASAAQPASAAGAPDKAALICASREVTGSRMPVRECHTADQWVDIQNHGEGAFSLEAQRQMPSKGGN